MCPYSQYDKEHVIAEAHDGDNVYATGLYRDNATQSWQAWAYNGKDRVLLGACGYEVTEPIRNKWEHDLWKGSFFRVDNE